MENPLKITLILPVLTKNWVVVPGPGPMILSSPENTSVEYASKIYPDRRVEVKSSYADPKMAPGTWSLVTFLTGFQHLDESPEQVKMRVVSCATRLIGISKSDGEAVLVAGPVMLRLLGFKLASIGYRGPFLRAPRPGQPRVFIYGNR